MAVLYTQHFVQFFDNDGNPLANGKLFTYEAGTTTPKATYTTSAATVENANPIVLDAYGRAVVFIDGAYRFDLFDSLDNLIRSTDNVTSFTTVGDAQDAYQETFSGDGTTVSFTTSESLGTDEKLLMVYAEREYTTNGNFAVGTGWTLGTGWSITGGEAVATGAISTAIEQAAAITLKQGRSYEVLYTITRSAGTITPNVGGAAGTGRTSSGTYSEIINAGSTQQISFTTSGFTGTLDNVSVREVGGFGIFRPEEYTINGTTLTFANPPASGANNIQVWSPVKLANNAAASAEAAASSESAAAVSAASAAASAGLVDIASTTSVAIGAGSKTFTIAANLSLNPGQWVLISSDADSDNYMWGTVTSYSSTTLIVDVEEAGGSGTYADWTIRITGPRGVQGPAGSLTATSAVVAATSAGASLQSNNNTNCLSWGGGGSANLTAGGNLSMGTTHKIVNCADPSSAQDVATKAYVDTEISGIGLNVVAQVATTSGTSVDLSTSIASGVNRVTISLNGVSTNGTDAILVQLGNGSYVTSGYTNIYGFSDTGGGEASITNGFSLSIGGASGHSLFGHVTLTRITSNTWVASGLISDGGNSVVTITGGSIALGGTLDRIRLTTFGGTNTFDAGGANLILES